MSASSPENGVLVVGICGGSCSGKSTLVQALCDRLVPRFARLCFDSYYRPLPHMSKAERDVQNFDHPDSLDHESFLAHLDALIAGQAIDEPIYDFASHDRLAQSRRVEPAPLLLVDGILLLSSPEVIVRLDRSIFVDADHDTRLARRLSRDVAERGRSAESVRAQFVATVAPMHARFVQPSAERADQVVAGDGDIKELSAKIAAEMQVLMP